MPAPAKILELVNRFQEHHAAYNSGKYNETQLRRDFLDPFFAGLGWDMNNANSTSEEAREVIQEYSMKIEGRNKAPDYCFRNGAADKFFVEAKKPSVNLKDDARAAFQTRVYGWNRNLPFCVLTDFEEFAVYDCRFKPVATESAQTARTFYCKYSEYEDKWPQIEAMFGREAVRQGALEKQASQTQKKGTVAFDLDFLKLIEGWRERLAQNIVSRNRVLDLSQNDLNYAVQMTIDRILFLRMCEDRDLEPFDQLKALVHTKGIYPEMMDLFRQADNRYNSGLFHFSTSKRDIAADKLTPQLSIDDNILSDMLYSLYLPNPYNFRVMSVEILGQVYEQFLGKVIRLDKTKTVVEDKPEVRKAGGVYYTPSYIVDYIVRETVGKMCDGKTPKQVEAIRVLDPACGSGSFLLGAYNFLLEWHLDFYTRHEPEKLATKSKPVIARAFSRETPGEDGEKTVVWRLTTNEKKRILQNNIFGVDIDRQAVEVSKLSLLLKMLEDENSDTLPTPPTAQGRLLPRQDPILPDIDGNIKCGNSLIGTDFYDDSAHDDLSGEERARINAFDWDIEYSNVIKDGGFDCVIGNPPYLYSAGQSNASYFQDTYKLNQYQTDFYVYFVEKGLKLAQKNGYVSFIVPDSWLNSENFSILRNHLLTKHRIEGIAVFDYAVFKKVTLENSIFSIKTFSPPHTIPIVRFAQPGEFEIKNHIEPQEAANEGLIDPRKSKAAFNIVAKMENNSAPLQSLVSMNRGIHAYRTDGYGKSKFGAGSQTKEDKELSSYHAKTPLDETYLPELKGKDVERFAFKPTGNYLSYGSWLAEPRTPNFFYNPKVVLRKILGEKLHGTYIEENAALDQSLYVLIQANNDASILKYVLGVLSSRLGAWYLRTKYSIYDTLYPWYTKKQLATFPMKPQDERMVKLVEQMLALQAQLAKARTSQDESSTRRQIAATDARIDKLVYELYDLSEEEIAVVESA